MTKTLMALALLPFMAATSGLAQEAPTGDAAAGANVFKKCASCHTITDADGKVLGGRGAKVGPNLYGMPGRVAGTYQGYTYGASIKALGETGFVWTEADLVSYVSDPTGFLKDKLGDTSARGKMMFKLAKEQDAHDVWAYILSLSPAMAAPAADAAATTTP